jgi:tellurite resistance protein TerC
MMYVFGAFLFLTGVKLMIHRDEQPHPEKTAAFRWFRRVLPCTPRFHGHSFFARENGKLVVTPLFLALAMIEVSDVIFAVDSIPAVFAITRDPFIVFTSNIFAILGLRSLYFLLANLVEKFTYLKPALSAVLVFVGVKMLIADFAHVPPAISLAVIGSILAAAAIASAVKVRRELAAEHRAEQLEAAKAKRPSPGPAAAARS